MVVGDVEYPGFPAAGATVEGVEINDPAVRVAFFALLLRPGRRTRRCACSRAIQPGNTARADFDHRTFPKPFKKSRIQLDDEFLDRVVPAILEGDDRGQARKATTSTKFLVDQRRAAAQERREDRRASRSRRARDAVAGRRVPRRSRNTAVGVGVRRSAHLRLQGQGSRSARCISASTSRRSPASPIVAANRGKVLFADELGIYGNCVILDHGMGVQSLYAHLSSIDVKAGPGVEKEQPLGRSGMTGLAGGDHLHFTMLVNGQHGEPGRVVGLALDRGPDPAQAARGWRRNVADG